MTRCSEQRYLRARIHLSRLVWLARRARVYGKLRGKNTPFPGSRRKTIQRPTFFIDARSETRADTRVEIFYVTSGERWRTERERERERERMGGNSAAGAT
jgi:hypothetical protein